MKLISAAIATAFGGDDGVPSEIVYLPEGVHTLTPTVDGKPQTITVSVTPERGPHIADTLQSALTKRQGKNVRPWFDFEHKRGKASGIPQGFRYVAGKGIVADVEWTGAGRSAVAAKDYSYFSPEFLLGDNGEPAGIPDRGPLGSLCNEPAFREIPRIAATDADQLSPTTKNMHILATIGLLNESEAARENAESLATQRVQAMKGDATELEKHKKRADDAEKKNEDLQKELDELKGKVKAADASRAETLVKAAVADGRIASKDEGTQKLYTRLIAAGDAEAESTLAAMPKIIADLSKSVIKAADGSVQPKPEDEPTGIRRVAACFAKQFAKQ